MNSERLKKRDVRSEVERLRNQLHKFRGATHAGLPKKGWVHYIRTTINMTTKQLGSRLNNPVTPQAIYELEKNEASGNITLNTLKKVAEAFNMELVYGFYPKKDYESTKDGDDVYKQIYNKLEKEVKKDIQLVHPESVNYYKTQQEEIKRKTNKLFRELPKSFWDTMK